MSSHLKGIVFLCAALASTVGCAEEAEPLTIGARQMPLSELGAYQSRLRDPDDNKAIASLRELGASRQPAASKLITAVYKEGIGLRRLEAVKALGALGQKDDADTLLNAALTDARQAIRDQAALEWARVCDPAQRLPRLQAVLNDTKKNSPLIRVHAVQALAPACGEGGMDALCEAMTSADGDVAVAAAEALSGFQNLKGIDALIKGIASANTEVRTASSLALERLSGRNLGFDLLRWNAWRKDLDGPGEYDGWRKTRQATDVDPAPPVDFVICFDATQFFFHAWADLQSTLAGVIRELKKTNPSCRVGLVRYRSATPGLALEYTILPTALTFDVDAIQKQIADASFGGGPGALSEGLSYSTSGMAWRHGARKIVVFIGDESPALNLGWNEWRMNVANRPMSDAMRACATVVRDAAELDRVQINTIYEETSGARSSSDEHWRTYRFIADAGIGRFFEYNKVHRHLVDMNAEKVDARNTDSPAELLKKWMTPTRK